MQKQVQQVKIPGTLSEWIIQMFRQKLSHISDYHGLNGPGLTCYLNSVLQVLFMTEDFREAMKRASKCSSTIEPHLGALFTDLESHTAKTHDVTKKLGITEVSVCKQRDAAEYFEKIMRLCSPEASKMFKGELNHKTMCLKCKDKDETKTPFWTLPLAMQMSHSTCSVEEGLKTLFKKEKVKGDNKLYCNCCGKKQETAIESEIMQHPQILTLLLKRFTFDDKHRCYVKLHCKVDVPQTLQVEGCTYDLYGLIHHFGSLTGGHYTAQIKSYETGEWYYFNDTDVEMLKKSRTENTHMRSDTAYLLMYKKNKKSRHSERACSTYSSEKAERKYDNAERGVTVHHDLPMHEICNTNTALPNTDSKKQTNQRATHSRHHKGMVSADTIAPGARYRPSQRTQNQNSSPRETPGSIATEVSSRREAKPERKGHGSDVPLSLKPPHGRSKGPSSSVSHRATNSTIPGKKNEDRMPPVVSAHSRHHTH